MGQTRQKQPSKRSLKAQQNVTDADPISSDDLRRLNVKSDFSGSSGTSTPSLNAANFTSFEYTDQLKIMSAGEKGLGVFATRKIAAGTLVLAEEALIRLTSEDEASESREESTFELLYKNLSRPEQRAYLALHDTKKPGFSRLKSIHYSNCYNLERYPQGGSCIGIKASRINHSCVPNVQFSFAKSLPYTIQASNDSEDSDIRASASTSISSSRGENGFMLFFALKDIARGKELFSNYSDTVYQVSGERQVSTFTPYGFTCMCQSCTQHDYWSESDIRRREMIICRNNVQQAEKSWRSARKAYHDRAREQLQSNIDKNRDEREDEQAALSKEEKAISPSHGLDAWMHSPKVRAEVTFAIANLEKLVDLFLKEGLTGIQLCAVYKSLIKWSLRADDKVAASRWSGKEKEACIICFGAWSDRVQDIDTRSKNWWKV